MAKQRTDTEAVINLVINGKQAHASMKELTDTQRKLNAEMRNMKPSDPGYDKHLKEVQMINKALDEQRKRVKGVTDETAKLGLNWKDIAGGIVAGFGLTAGIDTIKSLGKEIFEVTAKFEKMEAVLTTTLGSNIEAKSVMGQIENFAAITPFGVDELTESYVKLANQGFKPSMQELRKLGDLSASTGKNFDQLTEAIIDAQTGEFERLKEFGIRASKEGDKVTFSFKGVSEQVDFTASSIREYITALGESEGVSGSMAAISETLTGKVSNLDDNWSSLLKTVGSESQGVFSGAIDVMNEAISKINTYLKELNIAQKYNAPGTGFWERTRELFNTTTGQVDMATVQRSAFANISETLDEQIANAKYHSQLNDIIKNLAERMRRLDKTTREGAAAFQLYSDKIKAVRERAKSIDNDREQAALQKTSEARKKSAKEAEKLQKQKEKNDKKIANDYDKFKETIGKNAEEVYQKSLSADDKEIRQVQIKYQKLKEKAKGNKDLLVEIQNQEGAEMLALIKKQGEEALKEREKYDEETKKINKEEFKKVVDEGNANFAENKNILSDNYVNDLGGVDSEEAELQLKYDYQERERIMTEEHLLMMKMLYEAYGEDSTEIDNKLAEARLANSEREAKGRIAWTQAKQDIDSAYLDLAQQGTATLMGLVNKQSMAYKAMIVIDKALAIAKIVMATQTEIAGYYAANALLGPVGMGIATSQATAAKIRAGISIGLVAATGIAEFTAASGGEGGDAHADGVRGASPGKKLLGEQGNELIEKNGKWWLTDGPTMANFSGGENVYNAKETTDILKNSLYPFKGYSINAGGVAEAERNYRSNGTASGGGASLPDLSPIYDAIAQVAALQAQEAQKSVILEYKTFDDFKKKIETAYNKQIG